MNDLTVHVMVRDEPLTYYAVRSVYDLADAIMLVDTGTRDPLSQLSIREAIEMDRREGRKLTYVRDPIPDERAYDKFDHKSMVRMRARTRGKRNKAVVRREMVQRTKTRFFMIVDGDEIYQESALAPIRAALNAWPAGKCLGTVKYVNLAPGLRYWGPYTVSRLFLTRTIRLGTQSPDEQGRIVIGTRQWDIRKQGHLFRFDVHGAHYVHCQALLKPWRVRSCRRAIVGNWTGSWPAATGELPDLWKACLERMKLCATA